MAKPSKVSGLGPKSSAEHAALRLLAARLADVRRYEAALEEHLDPEPIHDMRTAARRLRVAIRAFAHGRRLEARALDVKALQDALGKVRDLQVQLAWLSRASDAQSPANAAMREVLETKLPGRQRALRKALDRWTRRAAPAIGAELGRTKVRGRFGGKSERRHLRKRLRRVEESLAALDEGASAARAHTLRLALKKLRYEAELLEQALPDEVEALREALTPVEGVLGELHDADVRLAALSRQLLKSPGRGLEQLTASVAAARVQLVGELRRALGRWERGEVLKGLRRQLA